jgi:replicative DNA helicase Mcm
VTERPVPVEVLRAWVAHARDAIHPTLSDAAHTRLKEFYVEVRSLNDPDDDGPGETTPIPATPRSLEAGIRLAMAFARCELSETVEPRHAERAIDISRATVGTNFDPATGQFDASKTDSARTRSQKDRVETVKMLINESEGEEPASVEAVIAAATAGHDLTERQVEETIEKLKQRGAAYEPSHGEVRLS